MESWSRTAQREHTGLLTLVTEVETATSPEDLSQAVRQLAHTFALHSAREEADGGFLAEARSVNPQWSKAIDELIAEHATMKAELAACEANLPRARAACAAIRDHERREADLLAEVAYFETGDGD